MKFIISLLVVLFLNFNLINSASSDSSVIILKEANFDSLINSGENWFIEFYAPWCGHCKRLTPIWEQLAKELKIENLNIKIAKVDCTTNSKLQKRFSIRGFPTLKYISNGIVYDYSGARSLEQLKSFAIDGFKNANSAPLPNEQSTLNEATDFFSNLKFSQFSRAFAQFEKQYGFSIWLLFAASFFISLFLSLFLLYLCFNSSSDSTTTDKKSKKDRQISTNNDSTNNDSTSDPTISAEDKKNQ
eukprot:TRINITY_DN37_c0_g2_i1.p1 TRINITY_DN37_c0_g2~~TRINITY_DN37_c0_g2_i1.p1  ORF type:complete len:244 (-),score=111.92 TRINITY_DN37_c0_g2_i1:158-889(-)